MNILDHKKRLIKISYNAEEKNVVSKWNIIKHFFIYWNTLQSDNEIWIVKKKNEVHKIKNKTPNVCSSFYRMN